MSTQLKQITPEGSLKGALTVESSVFGMEPNTHTMYLAVRRELANGRAGTACAKTRAEVRGGGKKPYKQKGTGKARAGSTRSPLWKGGGVIFGPKPRDYSFRLNKKVRRNAICSALSASADKTLVVENFAFLTSPKTSVMANFLASLGLTGKKVLILADLKAANNQHLLLSARNIPKVKISLPLNLSVRVLLDVDAVVATQGALQLIEETYRTDG